MFVGSVGARMRPGGSLLATESPPLVIVSTRGVFVAFGSFALVAFALEKKRKFDGRIDDVMMWKRALSEKELHAIFDDQKKSKPRLLTAKDIAPLIKKLGSEKFKDREEAQRQLIELDTEILPLLKSHRQSDDPEIALRLKQIEKAIDRNLAK